MERLQAGERVFVSAWQEHANVVPHGPYGTLVGESKTPDFLEVLATDSQQQPVVYPFVHRDFVWPA